MGNYYHNPTPQDYVEAFRCILLYTKLKGRADNFNALSKLMGISHQLLYQLLNKKYFKPSGTGLGPDGSWSLVYRRALKVLDIDENISPCRLAETYRVFSSLLTIFIGEDLGTNEPL